MSKSRFHWNEAASITGERIFRVYRDHGGQRVPVMEVTLPPRSTIEMTKKARKFVNDMTKELNEDG